MLAELVIEGVAAVVGTVLDAAFGSEGDDEADPDSEGNEGENTDEKRTRH